MLLKMFLPILFGALLWPNHLTTELKTENHSELVQPEIKYLAEEGRIGITMPGEYSVSLVEDESIITTKVTSLIDEVTYLFSWTLHTEPMKDGKGLADVSLESFNEQVVGEIESRNVYKYGKSEGVNATISLMEGQVHCFYQVIILGQYQFQMVVVTEAAELDEVGKRFLDSFKYKNK